MWKEILKKVIIATIATVCFSLALSIIAYEPKGEQHANTSSMTFFELFILYAKFSGPAYFLSGVGFSLSMDSLQLGFSREMFSYTVGGGVIAFVFYFVFFQGTLDGFVFTASAIALANTGGTELPTICCCFILFPKNT